MKKEILKVGNVGNYYGGLIVKEDGDQFFWAIENYNGCKWEPIPEHLYRALTQHQDELEAAMSPTKAGGD